MNKKLKSFLFCLLPVLMLLSFPISVLGIAAYTPQAGQKPITDIDNLLDKVDAIVTYVYYVLFIVAIFFIIWAAFSYLGSKGDAAKVKKASEQLIYAIVAIAVGLLAYGVTQIIENFLSR
jgi:TRAP-type C4-dicarboxylate transport system permease small subunit